MMPGGEYPGMADAHAERQAAMAASASSLHPFFTKSRAPETPLSEAVSYTHLTLPTKA